MAQKNETSLKNEFKPVYKNETSLKKVKSNIKLNHNMDVRNFGLPKDKERGG